MSQDDKYIADIELALLNMERDGADAVGLTSALAIVIGKRIGSYDKETSQIAEIVCIRNLQHGLGRQLLKSK